MKWHGRRQSEHVEEEPPLNPVNWIKRNEEGWERPTKKPRPQRPEPLEVKPGSEFAQLLESSKDYQKDAVDRGMRQGWMDAKYNKRDYNWKHSNFKRGGMIKGAQCRDYGKK